MGYYYYDTPEGKDCDKKLLYVNKYALGTSVVYSVYDVLMFNPTKGYIPTAARFAYNLFPFLGAATAFTAVTCMAATITQKDRPLNYVVAGLASGAVIGAWRGKLSVGLGSGAALAAFGVVLKTSVDENWEFFPKTRFHKIHEIVPDGHKVDFSLCKTDVTPNWSTK